MSDEKLTEEEIVANKVAAQAKKDGKIKKEKAAKEVKIRKVMKEEATVLKNSELIYVDYINGAKRQDTKALPYEGKIVGDVMVVFKSGLTSRQLQRAIAQLARLAPKEIQKLKK